MTNTTTTTAAKTFTINNHGAMTPDANCIVPEEFYNKVQQMEQLLKMFQAISPALSASLRKHYRNGISEFNVDKRLAFLSSFKLGLASDILDGMGE
tara:strand:- start:63 stop:350 length:288 start_codon:yes stop_codon:yes gene_type:complete